MRHLQFALLVCLTVLAVPSTVQAWMRMLHEDAILVKRSELIVVGRLKPGTIVYIPKPEGRRGREYRATLIVKEVIKGECKDKEIPILIHHGLAPAVGGRIKI